MRVTPRRATAAPATPAGGTPTGSVDEPTPSPWLSAAGAAVQATLGSLALVLAPVVVAWLAAPNAQPDWTAVLGVGVDVWLLGVRSTLRLGSFDVTVAPLGVTALIAVAHAGAGRHLSMRLDPRAERIKAGATLAAPRRPATAVLAVYAGAAASTTGALAAVAATDSARAVLPLSVLGSAVVAAVGVMAGAWHYTGRGVRGGFTVLLRQVPLALRPGLRGAVVSLAGLLLASSVLVIVRLVIEGHRVVTIHEALRPGVAGGAVLVLAQIAVLPDLVVWALGVIVGPGLVVGTGSSVTLWSTTLGALPAVPVLGGLPAPGEAPAAARALLAVPVLVGLLAGLTMLGDRRTAGRTALVRADLVCAAGVGLAVLVLAWASSGSVGPGRLAHVGVDVLAVAGAAAGLVLVGVLASTAVRLILPTAVPVRPTRPAARGTTAASAAAATDGLSSDGLSSGGLSSGGLSSGGPSSGGPSSVGSQAGGPQLGAPGLVRGSFDQLIDLTQAGKVEHRD